MNRLVFHYTDTVGFGGAEQALLHVLAGLDRGHWLPVLVFHPSPGVAPLLEGARRLGVRLLPTPAMPEGLHGAAQLPSFVRRLRAERPDVFHAHLTRPLACKWGLVGAIAAGVPAIVATVQLFVEVHASFPSYLQQRLVGLGVGRYIAVSHEVARRMWRRFRVPVAQITVVHNGIPLARFDAGSTNLAASSMVSGAERPIVLTCARLDEQKGHRYLLDAAALVPEAQFLIAGDGPLRAELEARAQRLGIPDRVTFLGYRADIPQLLSACHLFVLPSLYEGLPLSILEAQAACKPVISSAIGGTDEAIFHERTGLLVPPADPTALAAAIRRLLGDPGLAQRLAVAGQVHVHSQFSAAAMVCRVAAVYNELLEVRGNRNVRVG